MVVDTHAGAGLYRLDSDYAQTSCESVEGIKKLLAAKNTIPKQVANSSVTGKNKQTSGANVTEKGIEKGIEIGVEKGTEFAPLLQYYLTLVAEYNQPDSSRVYPGSPFIVAHLLRDQDKLKLFELHPSDAKSLAANVAQLNAGRKITVHMQDGFANVKKFLPPPSRRALVFCDPSYELKDDYARVLNMVSDGLTRFATGTFAVWYPIIPRPEAHDLPKRLKTLATKSGKSWLQATLTVKSSKIRTDIQGEAIRPGLPASGMFIINPPFTLKPALAQALPQLVTLLGQDKNAAFTLDTGG